MHSLLISSEKFDKGMFFVATERGLQLLLTACKVVRIGLMINVTENALEIQIEK